MSENGTYISIQIKEIFPIWKKFGKSSLDWRIYKRLDYDVHFIK